MSPENKVLLEEAESAVRQARREVVKAWRITEEAKLVLARMRKSKLPRTRE